MRAAALREGYHLVRLGPATLTRFGQGLAALGRAQFDFREYLFQPNDMVPQMRKSSLCENPFNRC